MFDRDKPDTVLTTPVSAPENDMLRCEAFGFMNGAKNHIERTWSDVFTGKGNLGEYLECGAETMALGGVFAATAGVEITGLGILANASLAYGAYKEQKKS